MTGKLILNTTGHNTSSIATAKLEMASLNLYIILFTLFVTPNILMILALFKTSDRHMKISQKLFIGLCTCDIAMLTCYFLTRFATNRKKSKLTIAGLTILLIGNYFQFLAVQIFLLITILRYWSIVKPLSRKIRPKVIFKMTLGSFVTSLYYPVGYLVVFEFQLIHVSGLNFERVAGSIFMIFVLPIAVINCLSYFHLRRKSAERSRTEALGSNTSAVIIEEEKSRQRKLRSVNTLCIITFFYVVCCFPNTIRMMCGLVTHMGDHKVSIVVILAIMYLSNSSINSIVYIVRTKNIRLFYDRLILKYIVRLL